MAVSSACAILEHDSRSSSYCCCWVGATADAYHVILSMCRCLPRQGHCPGEDVSTISWQEHCWNIGRPAALCAVRQQQEHQQQRQAVTTPATGTGSQNQKQLQLLFRSQHGKHVKQDGSAEPPRQCLEQVVMYNGL